MNRRGFHKMFFLMIAFVVLVLLSIFWLTEPRNKASLQALHEQKNSPQVNEIAKQADVVTTPDNKAAGVQAETTDELRAVLDELQPHRYHPDPSIEARTVLLIYTVCSKDANIEQWFHQILAESQRPTVVDDYIKFCAEATQRYPKLLGMSELDVLLKQLPTTSELGQMVKQATPSYDESFPEQYRMAALNKLNAVLASQNSALLFEASISTFMYFQHGEILPVSTWLNSQDLEYNSRVSSYALMKMACRYQQGAICEGFGSVSMMMCTVDNSVCGLDFAAIYEMQVMPGMHKDVELLISHLDQLQAPK